MQNDQSWLTLHQQFVQYGRNAKEWTRKCQLLLPQIVKQQIWRKKRFTSIYEYAAKLAGMNHDQVNEALRVLHKAEIFPSLMKVIEEKGINAVKPVIGIVTKENESLFAEKAMTMNKNTLEIFVRHVRENNFQITGLPRKSEQSVNLQSLPLGSSVPSAGLGSQNLSCDLQSITESCTSQKVTIAMQLNPETADELNKIKAKSDWNEAISSLLKLRREKLEQEKPKTVEVKTKPSTAINKSTHIKSNVKKPAIYTSRAIPSDIKKYVIAKTNGTCAFPGCHEPHNILHHTDRFAMYHTHDPDKIFPLCEAHEKLAHLGLIENENQPPKYWKLRAQPDYDNPKYEIDRIVERFRQPAKKMGVS